MKKYILWFWILFLVGITSFIGLFVAADLGWLGKMPSVEDLQNPKSDLASVVCSPDGKGLGKYFLHNRTNADLQDLDPDLVENRYFYMQNPDLLELALQLDMTLIKKSYI